MMRNGILRKLIGDKIDNDSTKRRFITIFPPIENIHLIKDVGMYPYSMQKYCDFESGITINYGQEYPYLSQELKGLKSYVLPSIFKNSVNNCFLWLICNAKKIDVLNLFHQVKRTRISIALYKRLNRKGKVYVHLDCDGTDYNKYQLGLEGKSIKKKIKRLIYNKVFYPKWIRDEIYWGVQNKLAVKNITGKFPYEYVEYMPNGFYSKNEEEVKFTSKENLIITVGRIGAQEKRTDILLSGFTNSCKNISSCWKLKIIGPIEPEFKDEIKRFFEMNPNMLNRVEFTGPIYDREVLEREYSKAKIFCLTSNWESFGIVLVEAMARGCTLLSSNFPSAHDITDKERYGELFESGNVNEFANKLCKLTKDNKYLELCCDYGQKYARNQFSYSKISKNLENWMYINKHN